MSDRRTSRGGEPAAAIPESGSVLEFMEIERQISGLPSQSELERNALIEQKKNANIPPSPRANKFMTIQEAKGSHDTESSEMKFEAKLIEPEEKQPEGILKTSKRESKRMSIPIINDSSMQVDLTKFMRASKRLSSTFGRQAQEKLHEPTQLELAIESATQILSSSPDDYASLMFRAGAYIKQSDSSPQSRLFLYAKAIKDYSVVIASKGNFMDALYLRGRTYLGIGQIDKGIDDFTASLESNPQHVNALYARASAYSVAGDFVKSIQDYELALRLDQENKAKKHVRFLSISSAAPHNPSHPHEFLHSPNASSSRANASSPVRFAPVSEHEFEDEEVEVNAGKRLLADDRGWLQPSPASPLVMSPCASPCPPEDGTARRRDGNDLVGTVSFRRGGQNASVSYESNDSSVLLPREEEEEDCMDEEDECSEVSSARGGRASLRNRLRVRESMSGSYDTRNGPGSPSSTASSELFLSADDTAQSDLSTTAELSLGEDLPSLIVPNARIARRGSELSDSIGGGSAAEEEEEEEEFGDVEGEAESGNRSAARPSLLEKRAQAAVEILIEKAERYISLGDDARRIHQYIRALRLYEEARKSHPKAESHYRLTFNLAFTLQKLERNEAALHEYSKAIQINKNEYFAYYNRGTVYESMGDQDRALTDFTQAIELLQTHHSTGVNTKSLKGEEKKREVEDEEKKEKVLPLIFYNRACSHVRKQDLQAAYNDLCEAVRLTSDVGEEKKYRRRRAAVCHSLGNKEGELEDYDAILDLDPVADVQLLSLKADVQLELQQTEAAIETLNQLELSGKRQVAQKLVSPDKQLSIQKYMYEGFVRRGDLLRQRYEQMKKEGKASKEQVREVVERAALSFEEALNLRPRNVHLYILRAECHLAVKKYQEVVNDCSVYLTYGTPTPSSYMLRGHARRRLERYREAEDDYTSCLRMGSITPKEKTKALSNRAYIRAKLNRHDAAVEDYEELVKANPEDASSWYNMAVCKQKIGREEEALEDHAKAKQLFSAGGGERH